MTAIWRRKCVLHQKAIWRSIFAKMAQMRETGEGTIPTQRRWMNESSITVSKTEGDVHAA